ncbi:MAG: hypothetical protein PQJ46_01255, partial [Spirochaetales bacterium]|nr:hypothetical protein [Spirochaetales bacterium]
MKKIVLIVSFLIITQNLFCREIYNSNILGMKLNQIYSETDADSGYYLITNEEDDIKIERLFENDRLIFERRTTET